MASKRFAALVLALSAVGVAQGAGSAATQTAQAAPGLQVAGQARDSYEAVLLSDPNDAAAQAGMSLSSERLSLDQRAAGNADAALNTLLRAKRLIPRDKRILLDLGILEEEMDLHLDAEVVLTELETMPPVAANAYYALARTDMSLGRLEEAEQQMQVYLKAQPLDASAHFGLGRIYMLGLHFDLADAELQRSIELQPKQTEAYYQLGQVKLSEEQYDESIRLFEKVLERSPGHGGALAGIGTAYFKMKQWEKADPWLLKATQVAPEYQLGHYYLGLTMARLGDAAGSKRELAIATTLAAQDNKQAASRLRLNPGGQP